MAGEAACEGAEGDREPGRWKSASPSTSDWLPYLLVAPQIVITLVFFFWPSGQAIWQSVLIEDAFGGNSKFVWFDNFVHLFNDSALLRVGAHHRWCSASWWRRSGSRSRCCWR